MALVNTQAVQTNTLSTDDIKASYIQYPNNLFRNSITYGLYPFVIFTGVLLSIITVQNNYFGYPEYILYGFLVISNGACLFTELLHPHTPAWKPQFKRDILVDGMNIFMVGPLSGVLAELLKGATIFLMALTLSSLSISTLKIWPANLPIVLQLVFALVITEFGSYWYHRLAHETFTGWRFHSLHHAPKILYFFNASRFQIFDLLMINFCGILPLILFGAPKEIVILATVFSGLHGAFQHANIRLKYGFLNYIIATSDLHRWHHSKNMEHCNSNYGNNLIIWDLVFGTFNLPKSKVQAADDIGIQFTNYPQSFFKAQLMPFKWRQYREANIKQKNDLSPAGAYHLSVQNTDKRIPISNDTILQILEANGENPKFRCRTGICGTCECKKINGQVINISNGEAYPEGETLIRPCVSKALSSVMLEEIKQAPNK